jgi:hypothetical protein
MQAEIAGCPLEDKEVSHEAIIHTLRRRTQPDGPAGPGLRPAEAAAIDALTYAYLQAEAAHNTELMRGGTIHATRGGYSYDEIHVTKRPRAGQIIYPLRPQDVARFHVYPRHKRSVNPANERPSKADRRTVNVIDPLHRPLYILHPSLVIRAYRGQGHDIAEVADLRHPARSMSVLLAGKKRCEPSDRRRSEVSPEPCSDPPSGKSEGALEQSDGFLWSGRRHLNTRPPDRLSGTYAML